MAKVYETFPYPRTGFIAHLVTDEAAFNHIIGQDPFQDDGRHAHCFHLAKRCRNLDITPEGAERLIRDHLTNPALNPHARAEQNSGEVRHAVANAYNFDPQDYDGDGPPKVKPYDPAQLAAWEQRLPFELTPQWLMAQSRIDVASVTPGGYLHYIGPGQKRVVVNRYRSNGGFIYEDHPAEDKEMTAFANGNRPDENGKAGAWFCANAVNGAWAEIGRDANNEPILSIKSGANLVSYDYAVLESDKKPTPEVPNVGRAWCAMLIQQTDLAIVSLVHTGNKSVHALIKIPARNKREFNREKARLIEKYTPLGLDPAALKPVQLTRLPGIRRSDNGKTQHLFYLNPKPVVGAIYKRNSLDG